MSLKDLLSPFTAWKNVLKVPVGIENPRAVEAAPRYRGFHVNDMDKCIGCGTCEEICQNAAIDLVPVEGIEPKNGDSGLRPMIDYGRCCWCALCVDVCTTSSLRMSNEYTWISSNADDFRFVPGAEEKPWDSKEQGYRRADNYNILDLERIDMVELSPEKRNDSFIEIVKGYSDEEAAKEAERCLECGICVATCPAHMDIPGYIRDVREGDVEEGLRKLYDTNPLSEVCGRVCTHKCETVCSLSHRGDAVAIRWLKRYIVDSVPAEDYDRVLGDGFLKKNGKKVAVVGAGPAGLSAAYYLSGLGYNVTIYESLPEPGGMMRYGIPEYRLPYDALDKDINYIKSLGVEIKCNTKVGKDISLEELHENNDVVFISTGLHLGRSTGIAGTDHENVFQSIELLREVTEGKEIKVEPSVVVIGGGNVAMDIARTLARLQRKKYGKVDLKVSSLEARHEMPADEEEIVEAMEEDVQFFPAKSPREIVIENGKIKGLKVAKCKSIFDDEGKFNPQCDLNDVLLLEASMIVESIGQAPDMSYITEDINSQLEYDGRRLKVDEYYQTTLDWLFVGGDIIKGPDVVSGIATGHKAAEGIDKLLNK